MNVNDRLVELAVRAAASEAPFEKCIDMRGNTDFWCRLCSDDLLLCRGCTASELPGSICDVCNGPLEENVLWCVLTFPHYGAGHVEDHFYAILCSACAAGTKSGPRPNGMFFMEAPNGADTLMAHRRIAYNVPVGTVPETSCAEYQRKHAG